MNKKKLTLVFFILVALLQLYVPAKMIFDREDIISTGKEYKFRTEPIDPNDPFRGKYIMLRYTATSIQVQNGKDWTQNEVVYVILSIDKEGYAKIKSVSKEKPQDNSDFVKAKVDYVSNSEYTDLTIDYPFARFYMEESKAPQAEKVYSEAIVDSAQVAYALINIKDGEAVIKDVFINKTSIVEIVKNRNRNAGK